MLNRSCLMGRITIDPELRMTTSGIAVITFTIAVERDFKKDGEKVTDFIDCVAWKQTAEFISQYFSKGKLIAIDGSIQVRNFEDKNGNKRKAVEVVAQSVSFCGDKASAKQAARLEPPTQSEFLEVDADDLPF